MADISSIRGNVPINLQARTGKPKEKKQAAKIDTGDKVEISAGKKAGKFLLGAAMSTVMAPANALYEGIRGSATAADKGLGIEGKQTGIGKNLQKLAVGAGVLLGAVGGSTFGPVGMITGAMMGPGAIGGLIAGGKGVIEGGKTGFKLTGKVAGKVAGKVSAKWGSLAGKAAKIATAAALGAIAIPGMALMKGMNKGIDFARKAIGIRKEPKTLGQAAGNLGKEGAVLYGIISGTIEASPGFVTALAGGISTAGGIGTGVAGVISGAKGFAEGVRGSFKLADDLINKKE